MSEGDKYVKLVEWSDEDSCFIGSCPELLMGGCHGNDPRSVFNELCEIIEETIELYKQDGKPFFIPPDFLNIEICAFKTPMQRKLLFSFKPTQESVSFRCLFFLVQHSIFKRS